MGGRMGVVVAVFAALVTLFNLVAPTDAVTGANLFAIILMATAGYVVGTALENWLSWPEPKLDLGNRSDSRRADRQDPGGTNVR